MIKLNHEGVINMLNQSDVAFWEYIEHRDDMERIVQNILLLKKAEWILKESLDFMNLVPNKVYGDNYKLCSKINELLKELK